MTKQRLPKVGEVWRHIEANNLTFEVEAITKDRVYGIYRRKGSSEKNYYIGYMLDIFSDYWRPQRRTIWVNEYAPRNVGDSLQFVHLTREDADKNAMPGRIRCTKFIEADDQDDE